MKAGALFGWAAFSGLILILIVGAWLNYHGVLIHADSLYQEILAHSFPNHPYWVALKRDYAFPSEVFHRDYTYPFFIPLLKWVQTAVGLSSWQRGAWTAVLFLGASLTAAIWAVVPYFPQKKTSYRSLMLGVITMTLLIFQAQNGLLSSVALGMDTSITLFIFFLSWGSYLRRKFALTGIAIGLLCLIRMDHLLLIAVFFLTHLLFNLVRSDLNPKANSTKWLAFRREAFWLVFPALLLCSSWWLYCAISSGEGLALSYRFSKSWLTGKGAFTRWFPNTDSGQGHPTSYQPALVWYEMSVRARWYNLITPYFGRFGSELALSGLLLAAGTVCAYRRPTLRSLIICLGILAFSAISYSAVMIDEFERADFLFFDVLAIVWIGLMILDDRKVARVCGLLFALMILGCSWDTFRGAALTVRPNQALTEGDREKVAASLARLNPGSETVLAEYPLDHALVYFEDRLPTVELPSNWNDPDLLDQFLDRFRVRWVAIDRDKIKGALKHHELQEHRTPEGYIFFEVKPRST